MTAKKDSNRRQLIMSLLTLDLLFALLFVFSAINIAKDRTLLGIGFTPAAEHIIIAIVVVLSLINIIIELNRIR
ncbi:MAG: hypothetical protein ACLFTH_02915 [Candidatus Woesearchaeota archaeon]